MKKTRLIIALSIIVVVFGGILLSDALGLWKTSQSRRIGKNNNSQISQSHEEDEEEDEHGIEISGNTTVGQALEMGVPLSVLEEYLGKINNMEALVRDLASEKGYSFGKIKSILNAYIETD